MTSYKAYAGIGAQDTPEPFLTLMHKVAQAFAKKGYTLRSGASGNADEAFEKGCNEAKGTKEIYVPWANFNNHPSPLVPKYPEAYAVAKQHHPRWSAVSKGAQPLLARNSHILLGPQLNSPVEWVICWTSGGRVTGGTGQGLRIAESYNIPIFNIGKKEDETFIREILGHTAP